jgi:hypothetical protein
VQLDLDVAIVSLFCGCGPDSERVLGPGSYVVQPGGVIHAKINPGASELLAIVYFDGPVDYVLAE